MSGKLPALRVLQEIAGQRWMMPPEILEEMQEIALRENLPFGDIEALQSKYGERLNGAEYVQMRGDVAVLPIRGVLTQYAGSFEEICGAMSYETIARNMEVVRTDPKVHGVVLDFGTPGGNAHGVPELGGMIRRLSGEKQVVAYCGGMMCSAGYWLGAAAGEVVINEIAEVGSIGVLSGLLKTDPKSRKMRVVSTHAPYKVADGENPEDVRRLVAHIDHMEAVFIRRMAEYRGVTEDHVKQNFGQGGMLVGANAVAAGMADRLGTLEEVIADLQNNKQQGGRMSKTFAVGELNREFLAEHAPDLLASIEAEAREGVQPNAEALEAARKEGAADETRRVKEVLAVRQLGHDKLLKKLAADGHTTAGEAALAVLEAEANSQTEYLENAEKGALKKPVETVAGAGDNLGGGKVEMDAKELGTKAKSYKAKVEAEGRTISTAEAVRYVKENGWEE